MNPLVEYLEQHPDGRMVHRWRHYFDVYHRHLSRFRGQPIVMVEIGVMNGGSLPMWRSYFGSSARIVGVDINPECAMFAEPGIDVIIGDQADRAFLRSLADRYPDFAIVVDDGGHRAEQQIATFETLFPFLASDGVFITEDTHSSYMPTFGGGYGQPHTFIEKVKPLIDRLNGQPEPDVFTLSTDSIHFYTGIVAIEKRPRTPPVEVVCGSVAEFQYIAPGVSGR